MTDAQESATGARHDPLIMGRCVTRCATAARQDVRSAVRVMVYLGLNDGAMLSDVSNHVGLSRPTMSKMVDALVRRRWVSRRIPPDNRRSVRLGLTESGRKVTGDAREEARRKFAVLLGRLSSEEQKTVVEAMALLGKVFAAEAKNRNGRFPDDLR